MDVFEQVLNGIADGEQRKKVEELLSWTIEKYPNLKGEIKWNQPMFTNHGTFIIAYSFSKKHIAVAPENVTIIEFQDDIINAGYDYTKELFRIPWERPIDYELLSKVIDFNIEEKKNSTGFWR